MCKGRPLPWTGLLLITATDAKRCGSGARRGNCVRRGSGVLRGTRARGNGTSASCPERK